MLTTDRFSFSLSRWLGIVVKEFLQLARDRITFAMMLGLPVIQMALFGFAINTDPKHMPTGVIVADHSEFSRRFLSAMAASTYFDIAGELPDEAAARTALAQGRLLFVVTIPANFSGDLLRGQKPALLVEADATDPATISIALTAITQLAGVVSRQELKGVTAALRQGSNEAFEVRLHRLYNPEGITQYNVVPGLMGVILTMTMVMMTALAITRERERGTMENLLAMPVRPIEVMTGKLIPYIGIGLVQTTIILLAARFVFGVPVVGSVLSVYLVAMLFIAASLTVGITISSLAKNQLQAFQLAMFYFLPSIILSGFMFPFAGMPGWAQGIGNILPLTYFNRLIRGVLIKGNGFADLWPDIWPLILIMTVVMGIAIACYRRTLD